jgi:hypothetical protein
MLVSDILTQSRYILSDTDEERWTNTRLISLLNNGLRDIAKRTTLFEEVKFYVVQDLLVDIDLTSVSTKITRAEYLDEPLPIYSFEEMDEMDPEWQLEKGTKVKAIVTNHQQNGQYKQYPIVENAQNDHIVYNQLYGVTTDISYSDIQPVLADTIGDIALVPAAAVIKFYYVRKHSKVSALADELNIDDLVEQPLIHYVAGMALRDNQDVQNRGMAKEELDMYEGLVRMYSFERSKNFSRHDRNVTYRPLG